jgi:hypothetical protein
VSIDLDKAQHYLLQAEQASAHGMSSGCSKSNRHNQESNLIFTQAPSILYQHEVPSSSTSPTTISDRSTPTPLPDEDIFEPIMRKPSAK